MSNERWTVPEVAAWLAVKPATVRGYLSRGQMPEPDARIDKRTPAWRPETIKNWNTTRQGKKK